MATDRWPPTDSSGGQPKAMPPTSPGPPSNSPATTAVTLASLPEVLTVREAAKILRIGRNQLYQAVAAGQLRSVRIGRSIRIPKQALLELLVTGSRWTASGDE